MLETLTEIRSRTNLNEDDLQAVLRERDECRARGDELGYAHCLLTLAHVVKWARSDTDEPPFQRAFSLANEALPIMRRHDDKKGLISALLQASNWQSPETSAAMLDEGMELAEALGDDREVARVLTRQAARLGMSDRPSAARKNREALKIYERLGDTSGQALCLFSLSIQETSRAKSHAAAQRSAELERSMGKYDKAARATQLALMYWPKNGDLREKRTLAEKGLEDAYKAGKTILEEGYYRVLAEIAEDLGNTDDAERYRRWQKDIEESDGLTPEQRRQNDIEMTKSMIEFTKMSGDAKTIEMFSERLKELEAESEGQ